MDFDAALNLKQFYRFTGPPEHWLTAIKYMTWGLEATPRNQSQWEKLQTGDIFFIHSSAGQTSAFPQVAASGIIGIGVVGFHFSVKDNYLWHYEIKNRENRWPLLIPLTELYLFSELPDPDTWKSPEPRNDRQTHELIIKLVANRVPLAHIKGFPQMGSFSSVSFAVAQQILFYDKPLYVYSGHSRRGAVFADRSTTLTEISSAEETLRSVASLRFIDKITKRIILKPYSLIERDNDILARAESAHYSILQSLLDMFKAKGYATLSDKHVDLLAHNGERSFLFEVKSTENKNFRTQARKGIVQLLEYDYFEINKFKKEKELNFKEQYEILVPSREPPDNNYIDFINAIDLGVAVVDGQQLKPIGKDLGFSRL